jgi:uncharacterized membrane protein YoaK (UPF0700 family)
VNIGFVTGTLNRLAVHVALAVMRVPLSDAQGTWDTYTHRALLVLSVWLSFLTRSLVSGAGTSRLGTNVLVAPLHLLLELAVLNPSHFQSADGAKSD